MYSIWSRAFLCYLPIFKFHSWILCLMEIMSNYCFLLHCMVWLYWIVYENCLLPTGHSYNHHDHITIINYWSMKIVQKVPVKACEDDIRMLVAIFSCCGCVNNSLIISCLRHTTSKKSFGEKYPQYEVQPAKSLHIWTDGRKQFVSRCLQ